MKSLIKSFGYAFCGIYTALKNERNMRIHTVCMIYMYFFLLAFDFFEITKTQFAIIFIANGLVMGGELINTAIEACVNMHGSEKTENGKTAKDCAAGAVLIFAIFSVACGIAIMYQPKAFSLLFNYFSDNLLSLIVFILSLIVSVIFIFLGFGKKENK